MEMKRMKSGYSQKLPQKDWFNIIEWLRSMKKSAKFNA